MIEGKQLGIYTHSVPPTLGQDHQVRVTMCRDHVICNHVTCTTQGHVTSKQCKLTGGLACRAHVVSCASHQVWELAELAW